jgi:hypothetical protein
VRLPPRLKWRLVQLTVTFVLLLGGMAASILWLVSLVS